MIDLEAREHFVYRVYDRFGNLLYIGRTKNPRCRIAEHRRDGAAWLPMAARYKVTGPLPYGKAHRLESELIADLQPHFNRRGLLGSYDARSVGPFA